MTTSKKDPSHSEQDLRHAGQNHSHTGLVSASQKKENVILNKAKVILNLFQHLIKLFRDSHLRGNDYSIKSKNHPDHLKIQDIQTPSHRLNQMGGFKDETRGAYLNVGEHGEIRKNHPDHLKMWLGVMVFPNIDPYILRFGELGITWYSLAYVFGIIFGWQYCNYIIKRTCSKISLEAFDEYITWLIISIIVGGRLGHVLFYELDYYIRNPIEIFMTYKGGMSFHGGLIGVGISSYIFCKKHKINFLKFTDLLSQGAPIGLFLGRIANFINGELYGSPTSLPWGMVFPHADNLPRHPSQLYEAATEGIITFAIMYFFSFCKKYYNDTGRLTGIFLICYGVARFMCEFFRVPDFEISIFSSGQIYSLPMIILGIYFISQSRKTS